MIVKIDKCKNNLEKSTLTKVNEFIPSSFSMSTVSLFNLFKSLGNKYDVYRGMHCMNKFCEPLREHAMEITNFKNKKNY